jgi:hypothetical protein
VRRRRRRRARLWAGVYVGLFGIPDDDADDGDPQDTAPSTDDTETERRDDA